MTKDIPIIKMNSKSKLILLLTFLISALSVFAEESPSKQINAIIRGGEHVYAEATAEDEEEAIKSCEELIKVEISKYLAEKSGSTDDKQKVIKKLDFDTQVITVPRKTKVRVFMYISKAEIDSKKTMNAAEPNTSPAVKAEPQQPISDLQVGVAEDQYMAPAQPVSSPVSTANIIIDKKELPQWQIDALKSIISQVSMNKVKNRLNSYKAQYKVKRIGEQNSRPTHPLTTFYAIFDVNGNIMALLAPSDGYNHYDYISGTTINRADYLNSKHIWFEFSK